MSQLFLPCRVSLYLLSVKRVFMKTDLMTHIESKMTKYVVKSTTWTP